MKKEQFFRLRRAKIEKKQLNLILKLDFVAKIAPEGGEKKLGRIFFYTCEKVKKNHCQVVLRRWIFDISEQTWMTFRYKKWILIIF